MMMCVTVMDMEAKELIHNDFVDINVSVASERGYVEPLIPLIFHQTPS